MQLASAQATPNPHLNPKHTHTPTHRSCPWARRLISVAGYPVSSPPSPLIALEYRLRVRGIMLPRRMKVQVPVPHSLQRVVHNPLYDMADTGGGGGGMGLEDPYGGVFGVGGEYGGGGMGLGYGGVGGVGAGGGVWPAVFAAGAGGAAGAGAGAGAAAVMAPPPGGGAAAGGGGAGAAVVGDGGAAGEGLMDNLEDILEGAVSGAAWAGVGSECGVLGLGCR